MQNQKFEEYKKTTIEEKNLILSELDKISINYALYAEHYSKYMEMKEENERIIKESKDFSK